MAKAKKPAKAGDNIPQTPVKKARGKRKRMTTQERVRVHIEDEKDIITEDDLKNVHLDLGLPKDHAHEPLPIENNPNRPKDEGKDKPQVTPWDVISE